MTADARIKLAELEQDRISFDRQMSQVMREFDKLERIQDRIRAAITAIAEAEGETNLQYGKPFQSYDD